LKIFNHKALIVISLILQVDPWKTHKTLFSLYFTSDSFYVFFFWGISSRRCKNRTFLTAINTVSENTVAGNIARGHTVA
jgi:hypothetical protein